MLIVSWRMVIGNSYRCLSRPWTMKGTTYSFILTKRHWIAISNSGGGKSKHSSIYLIKSYDVRWSDFSQTSAELALFQRVVNCGVEYERVHLISGSDMPLRNQDYIHAFFKGKKEEYLIVRTNKKFSIRIKYYHFFVR